MGNVSPFSCPAPRHGRITRADVERFVAHHNGMAPGHARSALDAALGAATTPDDVARRALRNLAAIYDDDDPCDALVACAVSGSLDAPVVDDDSIQGDGALGVPPNLANVFNTLTTAVRCKLVIADGDPRSNDVNDRVLLLQASLRRDVASLAANLDKRAAVLLPDQRHSLSRVVAVANAHLQLYAKPPGRDGAGGIGIA